MNDSRRLLITVVVIVLIGIAVYPRLILNNGENDLFLKKLAPTTSQPLKIFCEETPWDGIDPTIPSFLMAVISSSDLQNLAGGQPMFGEEIPPNHLTVPYIFTDSNCKMFSLEQNPYYAIGVICPDTASSVSLGTIGEGTSGSGNIKEYECIRPYMDSSMTIEDGNELNRELNRIIREHAEAEGNPQRQAELLAEFNELISEFKTNIIFELKSIIDDEEPHCTNPQTSTLWFNVKELLGSLINIGEFGDSDMGNSWKPINVDKCN